jgi:hypothetical protein
MKSLFTAKFIKEAKFDTKMFKVVEIHKHHILLDRFIKNWEGKQFIYLKNKYLNGDLELLSYYKILVSFEKFTNEEGKEIVYINGIKFKPVEYKETRYVFADDDEEF